MFKPNRLHNSYCKNNLDWKPKWRPVLRMPMKGCCTHCTENFDIYDVGIEGRTSIHKDVLLLSFNFLQSSHFFFLVILHKKKLRWDYKWKIWVFHVRNINIATVCLPTHIHIFIKKWREGERDSKRIRQTENVL